MTSGYVGWWACELVHNIDGAPKNGSPERPGISCRFDEISDPSHGWRYGVPPLLALLAVTRLAGGEAGAQARWWPEIGVRGGFIRAKPAGTSVADHKNAIDFPGVGNGSIFAIIPVWHRLALEPNVGFSQISLGVPGFTPFFVSATRTDLGLRWDYAITAHLFAAAGGQLLYVESAGLHDTQLGAAVAAGYRASLSRRFVARVEAQVLATARGYRNDLQPVNTYSALLGIWGPAPWACRVWRPHGAPAPPWPGRWGAASRSRTRRSRSGAGRRLRRTRSPSCSRRRCRSNPRHAGLLTCSAANPPAGARRAARSRRALAGARRAQRRKGRRGTRGARRSARLSRAAEMPAPRVGLPRQPAPRSRAAGRRHLQPPN